MGGIAKKLPWLLLVLSGLLAIYLPSLQNTPVFDDRLLTSGDLFSAYGSLAALKPKVERVFIARVMFSTGTKVICKVEPILFVTDKKDISLSDAIIDYVLHESRKKMADSMEIIEHIIPKKNPDWKISDL